MEVTYSISRGHLALASFLTDARRPFIYVLCGVTAVCFAYVFVRWESQYALQAFLLIFVILFSASWVVSIGIGTAVASLSPGKMPGVLGSHTIRLTEVGLDEQTDVNRTSHDWRAVVELRRSRFGQFVRFAGGTYFIPRDAFSSAAELNAFFDRASQLRAAAKS